MIWFGCLDIIMLCYQLSDLIRHLYDLVSSLHCIYKCLFILLNKSTSVLWNTKAVSTSTILGISLNLASRYMSVPSTNLLNKDPLFMGLSAP